MTNLENAGALVEVVARCVAQVARAQASDATTATASHWPTPRPAARYATLIRSTRTTASSHRSGAG